MKKDPKVFIGHIIESIELIEEYVAGITKEQFVQSHEKQDSVIRRLEIIGEAAKNIPMDLREAHPNIPWREMAGTRRSDPRLLLGESRPGLGRRS